MTIFSFKKTRWTNIKRKIFQLFMETYIPNFQKRFNYLAYIQEIHHKPYTMPNYAITLFQKISISYYVKMKKTRYL